MYVCDFCTCDNEHLAQCGQIGPCTFKPNQMSKNRATFKILFGNWLIRTENEFGTMKIDSLNYITS